MSRIGWSYSNQGGMKCMRIEGEVLGGEGEGLWANDEDF